MSDISSLHHSQFYWSLLTTEAREEFDESDLFPEEAWRRQQDRVEKEGESG